MVKQLMTRPAVRLWLPAALACLMVAAGPVLAEPTLIWLDANYPWDLSANGKVAVGNTGDGLYETFRWTEEEGIVRLGMSTVAVFGNGSGTPDVSEDGNHVSATVLNADSTYITQGLWTKGEGWEFSMPPLQPDSSPSGEDGEALGSAWGLSGDGATLTGFYWRTNDGDGTAHTNTWSSAEGFTALESPLRNCRGNALNYDGSVVVGWSERFDGVWCPTVWENGTVTQLNTDEYWSQATWVSLDGNAILGNSHNAVSNQLEASLWLRTDSGWQVNHLGVLPGTFPGYGQAIAYDMTDAGDTIVGYNEFNWGQTTGFVWTLEQGMVPAADFLAAEGFVFPDGFQIASLTAISSNGAVICGFGYPNGSWEAQGFLAVRENVSPVAENQLPGKLRLEGNYPNPFNPSTTIALAVEHDQQVRLDVFDAAGRRVRTLHDGVLTAGRHQIVWNGQDDRGRQAASGVYFARVRTADGQTDSRRMMMVK